MILRALQTSGFLDISSVTSDNITGPQLRITLSPGQVVNISDSYRGVAAINSGIEAGLLELVSYSTDSASYVVQDQVQQMIDAAEEGEVTLDTAQTLTTKTFTNYGEGVVVLGSISGATALNLVSGNVFTATVTNTTTFSVTNPRVSGVASSFVLILTNGGASTVNWPTSFAWPAGTPPTLTVAGVDVITGITVDGGTLWHVAVAQPASALPA